MPFERIRRRVHKDTARARARARTSLIAFPVGRIAFVETSGLMVARARQP